MAKKRSFEDVMHRWKRGQQHSGKNGPHVPKDRQDWALAIAFAMGGKPSKANRHNHGKGKKRK